MSLVGLFLSTLRFTENFYPEAPPSLSAAASSPGREAEDLFWALLVSRGRKACPKAPGATPHIGLLKGPPDPFLTKPWRQGRWSPMDKAASPEARTGSSFSGSPWPTAGRSELREDGRVCEDRGEGNGHGGDDLAGPVDQNESPNSMILPPLLFKQQQD